MPAADYWDSQDFKAVLAGGLVREDVMDRIFDISRIPLPFQEAIAEDGHVNDYAEWTQDALNAPDLTNAVVSGADAGTRTDSNGKRVGNHSQTSVKYVYFTERGNNVDVVGQPNPLAYGLMQRQRELRQDVEAIALANQASQQDDNNTTPGLSGGFDSWLESNLYFTTGGAAGGFNTATKIVDAHTDGTAAAAGSLAQLSALIESTYLNNGTPTILMSTPAVTKRLAQYLFQTNLVATPTANVSGTAPAPQASQGFINVMITDFGFTMEITPNRLQQEAVAGRASLFGIDPQMVAISYLHRYKAEEIAKLGLSHRWQITVDWTVKVYEEKAHFNYRDIDVTADWGA